MKLKNKKTGKVIKLDIHCIAGKNYESLAELNAEWEDYEEPKSVIKDVWFNSTLANGHFVEIDFISDEEAEKAVEKLKAWKRLKDKGFRFDGWNGTEIGSNISYISEVYYEGCADDMDLLFSGGEE